MLLAKQIKTGNVVVYQGEPIVIEKIAVQSPSARGAATLYKFRARNVVTKRRPVQVLYSDPTHLHIMDAESYHQYDVPVGDIEEQLQFLSEGLEGVRALVYNDECVGIELPPTVELTITQCDPGIKGASATSRTKPATLETGLVVQVPEYIKEGERIKVDTRTGEWLCRA
jgi:elongation factor P